MIKAFKDLNAWKEGHELVLLIYKITRGFPDGEKFSLTSQACRCAVSITSNIAEGFSRRSKKEKAQFLYMALGSLTELQNQLFVARDLGYINSKVFEDAFERTIVVSKLTNGLIKSSRTFST